MSEQKKYKLDIFQVLDRISKKDRTFFVNLSEEEQKSIQPVVLMKWLTGTTDAQQVYFMNELVNPFIFPFHKHKQLLINLMNICSPGRSKRYFWNKTNSKKTSSAPVSVKAIRETFGYNTRNAIDALVLLSEDEVVNYAENLGYQQDEIKTIKKELKTRAG